MDSLASIATVGGLEGIAPSQSPVIVYRIFNRGQAFRKCICVEGEGANARHDAFLLHPNVGAGGNRRLCRRTPPP